jgi:hypothetical protein
MRHESGDVIQTRDCVLLKSGSRKNDLPYIAKIAALWENPSDGEMMFSLLWYELFMILTLRTLFFSLFHVKSSVLPFPPKRLDLPVNELVFVLYFLK